MMNRNTYELCDECGEALHNMTGECHYCPPHPKYVEAGLTALLRAANLDWILRFNRGEWPANPATP